MSYMLHLPGWWLHKQSQMKPYNIVYAWKWAEYQKEMTKPFPLHLDPLDDHIPENEMI